jgi:hypothetical protein
MIYLLILNITNQNAIVYIVIIQNAKIDFDIR